MAIDREGILKTIADAIEQALGVTLENILERCRTMRVADARIILSYHLYKNGYTLTDICKTIGRKHPTVIYQIRQYDLYMQYNSTFRGKALKVLSKLKNNEQQPI